MFAYDMIDALTRLRSNMCRNGKLSLEAGKGYSAARTHAWRDGYGRDALLFNSECVLAASPDFLMRAFRPHPSIKTRSRHTFGVEVGSMKETLLVFSSSELGCLRRWVL